MSDAMDLLGDVARKQAEAFRVSIQLEQSLNMRRLLDDHDVTFEEPLRVSVGNLVAKRDQASEVTSLICNGTKVQLKTPILLDDWVRLYGPVVPKR